jgi:hypothetical protein
MARERRSYLVERLGHKLRSSLLALQEGARRAAFGQPEMLEHVHEQAEEALRRAAALIAAALEPKDAARSVVLAAAVQLAAPGAGRGLPADAQVRAPEPVLVEAITRTREWAGPGGAILGERLRHWWRLQFEMAPDREPLSVPELGEPLVRFLVDVRLDGWLEAGPDRVLMYLPAAQAG